MGHVAVACGASRLDSHEDEDGVESWRLVPDTEGDWAVFYAQNKSSRSEGASPTDNCVPALAAPRAEAVRLTPAAFVEYYLQRCRPYSDRGDVPTPWTKTGRGPTDNV